VSRALDIVRATCAALAARDRAAFLEAFAPGAVWVSPAGVTQRTLYVGHAELAEWWDDFSRRCRCRASSYGLLGDGRVVVFGGLIVREEYGTAYGCEAAWIVSVNDGLVSRVETRNDRTAVTSLRNRVEELLPIERAVRS
jgi:ketosteroid isomerase-like protein